MDLKVYLNEEKNALLLRSQSEGKIAIYITPLVIYTMIKTVITFSDGFYCINSSDRY